MIFGEKNKFAIECYHDPLENENNRVFGRMCIWCSDTQLGDITEPSCMLNVTEGFLQDFMNHPEILEGEELNNLGDRELFEFLNKKLYLDDERTTEEITKDAEKYFKYDFLTNGGESFDSHKSFLVKDEDIFKILFMHNDGNFSSCRVEGIEMAAVVKQFLSWIENE